MKKLILLSGLLALAVLAAAQPPQAFKYQTVVRDGTGEVLQNRLVSIRMSIHATTAGGTILYQETFSKTTNQFGLVNLEIGNGTPTIGTFAGIDWANGAKFLETEIDPEGGSNYMAVGTSEMLSVPYAMHAETVTNVDDADADPTNELQTLSINGNDLYISNGNVVQLPTEMPAGSAGQTIYHNGISWTASTNLFNNGVNIGIGTINPVQKLHVNGNIMATSFIGSGQFLNNLNASNITTGTLGNNRFNALSNLGGGSGTTFLRKDGTWTVPPNTTYTAGNDLTLTDTTFSLEDDIDVNIVRAADTTGLSFIDNNKDTILIKDGILFKIDSNTPDNEFRLELPEGDSNNVARMHIKSWWNSELVMDKGETYADSKILFKNDGTTQWKLWHDGSEQSFKLTRTGVGDVIYVNSGGDVCIGTSILFKNNGTTQWKLWHDGSENSFKLTRPGVGDIICVDSDGDMGIGTSTPATKLEVRGDNEMIRQTNGINASRWIQMGYNGSVGPLIQGDGYERLTLDADAGAAGEIILGIGGDNVGIGTNSPTAKLSVNGTANKPGGGNWAVFSDIRSKENIKKYKKGLNELMRLNPVSFNYKAEFDWGTDTYVGLIAQDVEKVVPSMVTEKKVKDINDFKEVDPSELVYILINAVKEQQKQIDELKADNNALKARIIKLENK